MAMEPVAMVHADPRSGPHLRAERERFGNADPVRALRLMQATTRLGTVQVEHTTEVKRLNAIISAQRDWIVTLERRLQTALNEVMELRGEGDDETV
jgi:hypothetical protein